jgi:hypothetical protein
MPLALDNLWSQVLRRPTQGIRAVTYLLCKSEIGNLDMSLSINQQVFRLQIPICDSFPM